MRALLAMVSMLAGRGGSRLLFWREDVSARSDAYGQTGAGPCDECGCPAYQGTGTYCQRSGCGHHWKSHANTVA